MDEQINTCSFWPTPNKLSRAALGLVLATTVRARLWSKFNTQTQDEAALVIRDLLLDTR